MNEPKIKPCPFCGGRPETVDHDKGFCWVYCLGCGAESETKKTLIMAIRAWNRRYNEKTNS